MNKKNIDIISLAPVPKEKNKIQEWANNNMPALLKQSAQFIDKPATQRMIEKNIKYITSLAGKAWDKLWSTQEGQESISHALGEALYHAATLPEMGSIVPFGNTAEFIPSIECYKFALETGINAPFKDINIILVHENDDTSKLCIENGNLCCDIKYNLPRGEIIGVVVCAIRVDTGKTIGEIYDVARLMEKAEIHSPSYRNYIIEKENFKRLKVEGKLQKDETGREYYIKKIEYTKDGKPKVWDKKIYEYDLINPYDGPDKPEMLKKAAGKTFFRPYMKTRNAAAMAEEWTENEKENQTNFEKTVDNVLNTSKKQFENIKDAEIVDGKEKNLFDEDNELNKL